MWNDPFSRRQVLKASAVALPLAAASQAFSNHRPEEKGRVVLGVATAGFRQYTNSQLAKELAKRGVHTVQLFLTQTDSDYWKYGARGRVSELSADQCRQIADAYRSEGIAIHSMGVYANLVHPDDAERKANLDYFEAMMKVGGQMGVRTFVTESGHYQPEGPAPRPPHHFQEEVWKQTVATARELARAAERHDAVVLVEPSFQTFFSTAKRTRVFLEEVNSPRIRALLDPANILELNDLEEMFDQLAPWIDCLHAKDYKLHGSRGVPAGQGDLDYKKLVTLAAERTPNAPIILEYVGPKDYEQTLNHLRKMIQQAGLREQLGGDPLAARRQNA